MKKFIQKNNKNGATVEGTRIVILMKYLCKANNLSKFMDC
jgi:hypothetical protein